MKFKTASVVKFVIVLAAAVICGLTAVIVSGANPAPQVYAASVVDLAGDRSGAVVTVTTPDGDAAVVVAPVGTPVQDEVPVHQGDDGTWAYGEPYVLGAPLTFLFWALWPVTFAVVIFMFHKILTE